MTDDLSVSDLAEQIARDGFSFSRAPATASLLAGQSLRAWESFAASWDDLGLDKYMADGGRYRRRRFAVFAADAAGLRRKPHAPHYQSRDYNALNGGIARWFDPILPATASHPAMQAVLRTCHAVFERLCDIRAWHVEVHQFRIEAYAASVGQPTPEGMHRDGVDYVLVLLVNRRNIASGVTSIEDQNHRLVSSFTLTDPMDAAWVDDHRVAHGVTAVAPLDPARPAHRDVLVVTFRRAI
jgi:hypothetical protein